MSRTPCIYVLAGVNGAGKSSISGSAFIHFDGAFYNPDEVAQTFMAASEMSQAAANSAAWHEGVRLLKQAIEQRVDFAFETTLGANTIPRLLAQAARGGMQIRVWYVGLSNLELHIERVQARVRQGGHDIPVDDIRRRYERSRSNLIKLLPSLTALRVFDNSADVDPAAEDTSFSPILVLEMERGKILNPRDLTTTPDWAKPIADAALKLDKTTTV